MTARAKLVRPTAVIVIIHNGSKWNPFQYANCTHFGIALNREPVCYAISSSFFFAHVPRAVELTILPCFSTHTQLQPRTVAMPRASRHSCLRVCCNRVCLDVARSNNLVCLHVSLENVLHGAHDALESSSIQ